MKALSQSVIAFLGNKTAVALVFSLLLVAMVGIVFNKPTQNVSADTIVGGGDGGGGLVDGAGRPGQVTIPAGTPLCGFAWGGTSEGTGMGVGWVSFNSEDCDVNDDGVFNDGVAGCPTSGSVIDYGVSVDSSNRLNGFAWSSTIGWIKFGCVGGSCLSSNPTTGGNTQQRATILANGQVHGWARACAGTNPGDCSSMTSRTDGWDGWISLRGGTPAYGVSFNSATDKFNGYSWGGPVVGWLNWAASSGREVRYCVAENLAVTLEADPNEGVETLNNVDLAVELFSNSEEDAEFIGFDCQYNGSSASFDRTLENVAIPENNIVRADSLCDYGGPGEYTAFVRVERGGLEATATAPISVEAPGQLGAVCTVNSPVQINQPATWRVDISPNPSALPPFTYQFVFDDGQPNPDPVTTTELFYEVSRSYSILGSKVVNVYVNDARGNNPAEDECDATTNVIVNPTIIEI